MPATSFLDVESDGNMNLENIRPFFSKMKWIELRGDCGLSGFTRHSDSQSRQSKE
jgi:hypothetical protein